MIQCEHVKLCNHPAIIKAVIFRVSSEIFVTRKAIKYSCYGLFKAPRSRTLLPTL